MAASPPHFLLPDTRAGASLWLGAGLAAFIAVSVAPIATFLILIVGFGFLHVLTELRYVDARFSGRLDRRWLWLMLALVMVIAGVRGLLIFGAIPYDWAIGLETAIGVALAGLGMIFLPRYRFAVGAGVLAFAAIAIASPLHALLTIAILHNLTPLGFFAERLAPEARRRMLAILSIPFVLIPLLIATGAPLAAMQALTGLSPDWTPFSAGPAERHMGAFLPPEFIGERAAYAAFAGAVFAQTMHYLATIVILPRIQPVAATTIFPWPQGWAFWAYCSVACGALIAFYLSDYGQAKALYGLFAAIHSWIEVPILIAALALADQRPAQPN
jgi:hypothetical protein